ncbi:winged helix-turn-helix domain-containing protein [soil metagenome]
MSALKGLSRSPAPQAPLAGAATLFIGRERELAEVTRLLSQAECRLLTLVGAGGVGKTRLAQQAMRELAGRYGGGSYFVPLESLTSAESMPSSIAAALGLQLRGQDEPPLQLARHIGNRHLLLVLDNFEHLLAGATLATHLLSRCPRLELLVTSREPLNLHEEWVLLVDGLSLPAGRGTGLEEARGYEAVRLFTQRAGQISFKFLLDEENLPDVIRICRLVEGSPLGIELASVWVRLMPVAEIAQEIETTLDFLIASTKDVAERHKSLRATFEHSWGLLTPKEQEVLARLSVFRGGFTRQAAANIAGALTPLLASLVDRSLVRLQPSGRYDRHPLLYQYSQEKLAQNPEEEARTQAKHGRYFLGLIEASQEAGGNDAQGHRQVDGAELQNVAVAWRWAVAKGRVDDLQRAAGALTEAFANRPRDVAPLLEEGLAVIRALPDTSERVALELALEVALGPPLMMIRGYAAPELEAHFARARRHCLLLENGLSLENAPQLFPALWGLWGYYVVRGECKAALELGEQVMQAAEQAGDLALQAEAHRVLEESRLWLGELGAAREHLDRALSLDDAQPRLPSFLYGHAPGVTVRGSGALTLWCLGYLDRSLKLSQDSIAVARASPHPNNLGLALTFANVLGMLRREAQATKALAETTAEIGKEHNIVLLTAIGTLGRGWALGELGWADEGLVDLRRGLASWHETGAGLWTPFMYALLADACGKSGRAQEGLTVLERAFAHVLAFGERWCESELYRLKGELLLEQGAAEAEVEEAFWGALEVARRQGAKSWELRAVGSLSRFRVRQGKTREARTLLTEVCGWFQEGFATPDLKEARELLRTLA